MSYSKYKHYYESSYNPSFSIIAWIKRNTFIFMIVGSILFLFVAYLYKLIFGSNNKGVDSFKHMYKRYKNFDLNKLMEIDEEQVSKKIMPTVSKGELRCKLYLEKLFNRPFTKIRPNMLKNNVTGQNLEIDLFNEELQLGVEYNGEQHYKYCKFIHKNYEHFQTQKYRDEIKKMLCKEKGICLIEVHFKEKDIETYLYQQLILNGYQDYFVYDNLN